MRLVALTPHFRLSEFACRDGTPVPDDLLANVRRVAAMLEILRARCGERPVTIVSGYRTPEHNRRVGGAQKSRHLTAEAADIRVAGYHPRQVQAVAQGLQAEGVIGGLGIYSTFTHVDLGPRRTWWGK